MLTVSPEQAPRIFEQQPLKQEPQDYPAPGAADEEEQEADEQA